jgi:hypothetical protein
MNVYHVVAKELETGETIHELLVRTHKTGAEAVLEVEEKANIQMKKLDADLELMFYSTLVEWHEDTFDLVASEIMCDKPSDRKYGLLEE